MWRAGARARRWGRGGLMFLGMGNSFYEIWVSNSVGLRNFFFFGPTPDSWARLPLHWTTELERPVQTRLAGLSRDDHFRYMKQSCEFILIGYSIKFWNTFTTLSSTMLWSKYVLRCMTETILPWGTDKHVLIKNVHNCSERRTQLEQGWVPTKHYCLCICTVWVEITVRYLNSVDFKVE